MCERNSFSGDGLEDCDEEEVGDEEEGAEESGG